jgi:hypothetical protein
MTPAYTLGPYNPSIAIGDAKRGAAFQGGHAGILAGISG